MRHTAGGLRWPPVILTTVRSGCPDAPWPKRKPSRECSLRGKLQSQSGLACLVRYPRGSSLAPPLCSRHTAASPCPSARAARRHWAPQERGHHERRIQVLLPVHHTSAPMAIRRTRSERCTSCRDRPNPRPAPSASKRRLALYGRLDCIRVAGGYPMAAGYRVRGACCHFGTRLPNPKASSTSAQLSNG